MCRLVSGNDVKAGECRWNRYCGPRAKTGQGSYIKSVSCKDIADFVQNSFFLNTGGSVKSWQPDEVSMMFVQLGFAGGQPPHSPRRHQPKQDVKHQTELVC